MQILHSEELEEIISNEPHWFIRFGTALFLALLVVLVLLSWVVRYPVMVRCSFSLTSSNAPVPVVSKADSRITELLVKDNQHVVQGQPLAYLESTADHSQVMALEAHLDTLRHPGGSSVGSRAYFPEKLGELQAKYQVFAQAYTQFSSQSSRLFFRRKKTILIAELDNLQRIGRNLEQQQALYSRDLQLMQTDVRVQRNLARQGVIASSDLRREESRELAKQFPLKQVQAAVLANVAAQQVKKQELLALDKLIADQNDNYIQSVNALRSAIDTWKSHYVLTSPMTGSVHFSRFVEFNQVVHTNEEVFYMNATPATYYGAMRVPQQNLGKVQVGQQVLIRLDGYPFSEYGMLRVKVASVSSIPAADDTFMARVSLPHGLVTTYGRKVAFRSRISAQADIVTEDISLLARIFYRLHSGLANPD